MHFSREDFQQLDETRLRQFLEAQIPEGLYLDYKEDYSSKNEKRAKREFLKDVTAFANAHGGVIFIGVKEPKSGRSINELLTGIEEGDQLAHNLERLASSCIEPRIPGLQIRSLSCSNGKFCIGIHIPPSLSRPHMVQHEDHRSFYIRHSESSFPMSTHEIRESVVASMSAEEHARNYMKNREADVCRYFKKEKEPLFLIQAMPLLNLETPIEVNDETIVQILQCPTNGPSRRDRYKLFEDLCSDVRPRLTIDGLLGRDKRENPKWWTEIHRNGYISVAYRNTETASVSGEMRYIIDRGHCEIFRAFCDLVSDVWSTLKIDLPYAISSVYLDAKGCTVPKRENFQHTYAELYDRDEIRWPMHIRRVGEDCVSIADELCLELFNAFGLDSIPQ